MKSFPALLTGLLITSSASAMGPLPETTGWSGYVSLGVGGGSFESNMIADVNVIDVDLGVGTIKEHGSPDDKSFGWATVVHFSSLDGDAENPLLGGVNDADGFGFATQIFFKQVFGASAWQPNVSFAVGESDSDLDFYDSQGWMLIVGLARRF